MKKVFLAALALMGTYGITNANTVTVHNLTGCSYTLNFSYIQVFVGPGTSTFTSGPTWDFIACKVIYNDGLPNSISIGVGLPPGYPPYANSSYSTYTPPCLTSSYYTASWGQASSTANATLVIF